MTCSAPGMARYSRPCAGCATRGPAVGRGRVPGTSGRPRSEATRAHAVTRGWAPPLAWDDDQIDMADGQPARNWDLADKSVMGGLDSSRVAPGEHDSGAAARFAGTRHWQCTRSLPGSAAALAPSATAPQRHLPGGGGPARYGGDPSPWCEPRRRALAWIRRAPQDASRESPPYTASCAAASSTTPWLADDYSRILAALGAVDGNGVGMRELIQLVKPVFDRLILVSEYGQMVIF